MYEHLEPENYYCHDFSPKTKNTNICTSYIIPGKKQIVVSDADARTCLTSPSKACSVRTKLASVAMRMLCPSALNFMLFHRASDNAFAFFGRTVPAFSMDSST